MKDKLQEYLEEARKQQVVMSSREVGELLDQQQLVVQKNKWFNLKTLLIMITLCACSLALVLLFNGDPVKTTLSMRQKNAEASANKTHPQTIHKPKQVKNGSPRNNIPTPPVPHLVPDTSAQFSGLPVSFSTPSPAANFYEPAESYFNQEGRLILNDDELARLGIVTNGNTLTYSNRVDSVKHAYPSGTSYQVYYCNVNEYGGTRISIGGPGSKDTPQTQIGFWPVLHTHISMSPLDSQVHICRNDIDELFSSFYIQQVKPNLVPVQVLLTAKPGRFSNSSIHIFWFEPTQAFLDALPPAAAGELITRYDPGVCRSRTKHLGMSFNRKKNTPIFSREERARIKNTITVVTQAQIMEQLGFTGKGKNLRYENVFVINGKATSLSIISNKHLVFSANACTYSGPLPPGSKPFYPVAVSSSDLKYISYFYPGNNEGALNDAREKFLNDQERLIPVELRFGKKNYVFWFTDTPEIRAILGLSPGAYHHISSYDEYRENWAMVERNGLYGFINQEGEEVVPPIYDHIGHFNEYQEHWALVSRNGRQGFINNDGKEVVATVYDHIAPFGAYRENLALVTRGNTKGFIDHTGKEITNTGESDRALSQSLAVLKIHTIIPETDVLHKLRISFTGEGIRVPVYASTPPIFTTFSRDESTTTFPYKVREPGSDSQLNGKVHSAQAIRVNDSTDAAHGKGTTTPFPAPLLVTGPDGITWRSWNLDTKPFMTQHDIDSMTEHHISPMDYRPYNEAKEKAKRDLQENLNSLVPVRIRHQDPHHGSVIAWYKPDNLFYDAIGRQAADEIRAELEAITNHQAPPSCKYFENCGGSNGAINKIRLFPNPVSSTFTVEVELAAQRQVSLTLTDINGKVVKNLISNSTQPAGNIPYTFNNNNFAEGFYLLVVTTEKGERYTTRLIKKHGAE